MHKMQLPGFSLAAEEVGVPADGGTVREPLSSFTSGVVGNVLLVLSCNKLERLIHERNTATIIYGKGGPQKNSKIQLETYFENKLT